MKIPRDFTEQLRNQADIVRIVSDYVSLKKKGGNFWACCPFHNEKSASFSVHPGKQIFHCFGCGKGGDVFTFVMEIESTSFPEAIKTVAEKYGIQVPQESSQTSEEHDARDRQRQDLLQLNKWAAEFFQFNLQDPVNGKTAREYLENRGITEESVKYFGLGYALPPSQGWDSLTKYLRSKGASTHQIEASGLVTLKDGAQGGRSGSYDRFRDRVMFPITDAQGKIIAFGGRILNSGDPKYLNSPETLLYIKGMHLFGLAHAREEIRKRGYAVLVEGYLDFLIPFQFGVRNLVAGLGTALTENQVRLLGRYTKKIVVNYDPDGAGIAATKRSLESLIKEGFRVNVLSLPDNLDPDEFIRNKGVGEYFKLLKESKPFLDYVTDTAIKSHDQTKPRGKVETLNEILPYLRLVKDRVERATQIDEIANKLNIDSRLVREEFKKAAESGADKVSDRAYVSTLNVMPAEKRLLEILLNYDQLRRNIIIKINNEDIQGLRSEKLFRIITDFERNSTDVTYPALSQALDDDDLARDLLPKLMMYEVETDTKVFERTEWEATDCLLAIRREKLAEKQKTLQSEINSAQRANDTAKANDLMMQKFELAKKMKALM